MNSNRRVLLFVLSSVTLYLLFSFSAYVFGFEWMPFKRVNLISDVVKEKNAGDRADSVDIIEPTTGGPLASRDFNLYHRGRQITNFSTDSARPSLPGFVQALHELKKSGRRKIRIAYFGDSMIEGDLMTQTIRELLQAEFGGSGVGFVPVTSIVSHFRQTARASYSGGWEDESFKSRAGGGKLYFSGHLFRGNNDWVQIYDQTIRDSNAVIEKSLICGYSSQPVSILVNGSSLQVRAPEQLNRIVLARDQQRGIRVQVNQPSFPVYGISFESPSGIMVDNFSFRGITGIELARIDSSFLRSIAANNAYDLIVFQYGVNLLFRPNDKNFQWYGKSLRPVLQKFRNCFPGTEILVVSTADRAFRYNGQYRSAVGIDSLIKVQAGLAYETGSHFYNQYESMGGRNSIVDWASRNPSLANKDYVHPNHRGAEVLGRYFVEAILKEYRKYKQSAN
jgi:lysophospholipase L1-like esterase